ncbi:Tubulin alpha-A chain [Fasciola gigantica]|uniref:Tubulin alpha-A chain n=1 Tax=Fasciola gigantica TaxID=46835 RepID=A0A504YF74_FASGI|nr:Tubulin alpha-A chain [Fasciola gigantica]
MEGIDFEYTKCPKIELTVYPGQEMCSSVVEPYNAVLCSSTADETADVTVLVDNQALVRMCTELLKMERPVFSNINRILAQVSSGMTAPVRYEGPLTASLGQLQTNLVPFPRLHYLQAAMAPIVAAENLAHETIGMQDLTTAIFSPSTQLLSGDPSKTHVLACALLCRGDIAVHEIRNAVAKLKNRGLVHLVPWCPTGFKIGLCLQPPTIIPQSGLGQVNRSVVGLYNSTLVVAPIRAVAHKVTQLSRKRAFVHWYLQEGMEEGELVEAQEGIKMLLADFQHLDQHGLPLKQDDIQGDYVPEDAFDSQRNPSVDADIDALASESVNQANIREFF